MYKEDLRRQIRQIKRQFTPMQLEELSLPMARLKPKLAQADAVFAYYSLPDEVCTHQLIDSLVADGKTVYLPKVIGDETMTWFPYHSAQDLKEGAFHIMEPAGVTKESPLCYNLCCTILVPGVAFDVAGRRLGRGRGYYDRFLASHPELYKIGVCFDFQKVPEVPSDEYDILVDEVI